MRRGALPAALGVGVGALALIVTACASPGAPERIVFKAGAMCLAPAMVASPPNWPYGSDELPPVSLLRLGGYAACRAHQEGVIDDDALNASIAGAQETLLRAEAERFFALNGMETTGWVASSDYLEAACKGVGVLRSPPPAAIAFCATHFPGTTIWTFDG